MAGISPEVEAQVAALKRLYLAQLPAKIAELRATYESALANQDGEALFSFYRLAHSLAGSSGMYGMPAVGDKARELEYLVKQYAEQRNTQLLVGDSEKVAALFLELTDLVGRTD